MEEKSQIYEEERLLKLEKIALSCGNCDLCRGRKKLVFGEGSPTALIMFIGEGPGAEEDKTGRPFVGRSGKLLRQMISAIDISEEDKYIANIVKCRPPDNRAPLRSEIETCRKYLRKQIDIIRPRLLVLLGKTAVKGMCPNFAKESVEKLRSMSKSIGMVTFSGGSGDIPALVTYHPSALLRTAWRKVGAKEDFTFLKEKYRELVLEIADQTF